MPPGIVRRREAEGGSLTRVGEGFHDLIASFPRSDPANHLGGQTMPECRFNKSTAPVLNISLSFLSLARRLDAEPENKHVCVNLRPTVIDSGETRS